MKQNTDDCISRQAVLHDIDELLALENCNDNHKLKMLRKVVKDVLPSAQPKTFHVIDIVTGKEADPYEIALNEDWAKDLMYCDMEGFAIEEDGSLILVDECGRHEYCPIGRFEVVWDE